MSRPDGDPAAVAHALTGREGEGAPPVLGFAICGIVGFALGLGVRQGWPFGGCMATLLITAATAGWILRGLR